MKENKIVIINKKLKKPTPTKVYDTYWKFANMRQEIFFKRLQGEIEYTDDPILKKHKFTNVYRASDRTSQYLIKNVIYNGNQNIEEIFFRIMLFKTFNKIETWEYLNDELGEISYRNYSYKRYEEVLSDLKVAKIPIYSGAYIMTSGKSIFGFDLKHQNHLKLLEKMMKDKLVKKIAKENSMENVFFLLKSYPTIGDFLAYQYATDINYSEITSFQRNGFCNAWARCIRWN